MELPILPELVNIFTDSRGSIFKFPNDNIEIKDILIITSNNGSIRAGHYHKKDYHICILTKGSMNYYERPVGSTEKPKKISLKAGDVFYTAPMQEHLMEFTSDGSEFICLSHLPRNQSSYEEDTVRLGFDLTKV